MNIDNQMIENILICVITFIASPIITSWASNKFSKKNEDTEDDIPPLMEHYYFKKVNALKTEIDIYFELENKGKEEIFKDMLVHIIDIFQKNITAMVKDIEEDDDFTEYDLYNMQMECYNKSIQEFKSYYHNSSYTQSEKDCLDIVMHRFNQWQKTRFDQLIDSIETVSRSCFYKDTYTKAIVILDLYTNMFIETVNSAQLTLDSLNGTLKGLKFRNHIL